MDKKDKIRFDRFKTILNALKSEPCAHCKGVFPPHCMDFDHKDSKDKVASVGTMWSYSTNMFLKEVLKCRLLCKNCHADKSHKNKEWGRPKK